MSVREDHLLPAVDSWLGQLFNDDHLDEIARSLAAAEQGEPNGGELLEARRTIKDCDKRIRTLEIACETTNDTDTIAGFAQPIERIRTKPKRAEIRLRRLATGRGMTQEEIREVISNITCAVALLTNASPEDSRRAYEAAQLEILYDHEDHRAQLSVDPRVTGGVGGATHTPSTWTPWTGAYAAA